LYSYRERGDWARALDKTREVRTASKYRTFKGLVSKGKCTGEITVLSNQ
jgi:hypothetical protein